MRTWHVEYRDNWNNWVWIVVRNDGVVCAYCDGQAMAANICTALNFREQWVMDFYAK